MYAQGTNYNCCKAYGDVFQRVDYYSGHTTIFGGNWDEYIREHVVGNTDFTKYTCCLLASPSIIYKDVTHHQMAYTFRGAPYPCRSTMYDPAFTAEASLRKKYLRNDAVKKNLMEMYNEACFKMYRQGRFGRREHVPYYKLPRVQPFCSNKNLKHVYWKFPHKPTGNGGFIAGTIYYKIRYKCLFSGYFKTGHA